MKTFVRRDVAVKRKEWMDAGYRPTMANCNGVSFDYFVLHADSEEFPVSVRNANPTFHMVATGRVTPRLSTLFAVCDSIPPAFRPLVFFHLVLRFVKYREEDPVTAARAAACEELDYMQEVLKDGEQSVYGDMRIRWCEAMLSFSEKNPDSPYADDPVCLREVLKVFKRRPVLSAQ